VQELVWFTVIGFGEQVTVTDVTYTKGFTVMVVVPFLVGSSTDVAVMATLSVDVTEEGGA
jgi:hypothetical protein